MLLDLFIGERVKAARTEKEWTQYQLAQKSGLSWQVIANIENARTKVYASHIYAIAKATDKPAGWFLENDDHNDDANLS